ncbi:MAG: SCO family protein [Anaerolineae bacterium]|nr:SCO family protein [Caldilineales bacterium]MCX7851721.1 SCO family protein [Caldilineales bacterium]MDW8270671.1 SCO family protein [Anaerolineae bacterium]
MKTRRLLIAALLLVLVLMAGGWPVANRWRPHTFHGMVIQSPQPAPDFTLTTHQGQRLSLSDLRGRLVVLYFGYTFCPDVCPTTLSEWARAMRLLGPKADRVQVIMITVDPARDTAEKLGAYLAHFDPRFIGLVGTEDEIARIATLYGIYYQKHEDGGENYLVDHTATQTAIDQEGYIKLVFPFGTKAEDIADDLAYMLR